MNIQNIRNFIARVGHAVVDEFKAVTRGLLYRMHKLWHADEWSLRAIGKWALWQVSPYQAAAATLFYTLVDMEQDVQMYDTTLYWRVGNADIQICLGNFCDAQSVKLVRATDEPMFLVDVVFVQNTGRDAQERRRALLGMLRSLLRSKEYCREHPYRTEWAAELPHHQILCVQAHLRVLEYMYFPECGDQCDFVLAAAAGTRWLAPAAAGVRDAAVRALLMLVENEEAEVRRAEEEARLYEEASQWLAPAEEAREAVALAQISVRQKAQVAEKRTAQED